MKSPNASQHGKSVGRRSPPTRIPQIPMVWMDPMSWRLPSGQALAEFALQAGFLAPLMLSSPLGMPAHKKRQQEAAPDAGMGSADVKAAVKARIETQVGEGPEQPGTFRQTR